MSYTYRSPENETRASVNGIIVERMRVLLTQRVIFTAYEPSSAFGKHGTITTFDGKWYGKVATRRDDSTFAHLPVGNERSAAVDAHYHANYIVAYAAILVAFPEAAQGTHVDGDIEISY